MSKHGYRRLETSDDPDHFWLARIENSPAISQRMRMLAPFDITFDCKPQRFLKSGEEKIVFYPTDTDGLWGIKSKIYNQYGFSAKPLISIYADGNMIGDFSIVQYETGEKRRVLWQIKEEPFCLNFDCDTHNVYNDNGNQNKNVSSYEFPEIFPGENEFNAWGLGITKVEFTPRWWEL